MPDKDNNLGGSLGLDFRKWWRHVQPTNLHCFSFLFSFAQKDPKKKLDKNFSWAKMIPSENSKYVVPVVKDMSTKH